MRFKSGFTLSELIIALSIVGIIAAATVPTVVTKYQQDTQLVQLKKVYNNLQHNLTMLQTENYRGTLYTSRLGRNVKKAAGIDDEVTKEDNVKGFYEDYFKVTKDCGVNLTPCFASYYRSLNSSSSGQNIPKKGYGVQLADGTAMYIIPAIHNTIIGEGGKLDQEQDPVKVYVDVNGPDKPNIAGRDFFTFNIYDDYTIDEVPPSSVRAGTAKTERESLFADNCKTSKVGLGCFGKILNDDWKMNY